MKTTIDYLDFKNAISRISKLATKNISLPILETIYIEARGQKLVLRTTNLQIGAEVEISANNESEGKIAVKADVLINSLVFNGERNLKLILTHQDNQLKIKAGESLIKLKTYEVEDFPTLPKIENPDYFELESGYLVNGLKQVQFSASFSDIKPEIASVFIYEKEGDIFFVATDSYRLAEKKQKINQSPNFTGVLIPIKSVNDLIRIIGEDSVLLKIAVQDSLMIIVTEGLFTSFRVVDGSFPDYKQIIPKEHTTEVIALKQDLLSGLKLIGVFSDKFNQVLVTIENNKMTFFAENSETGDSNFNVDSVIKGEDVVVKVNHRYLLEGLQAITDDSVKIHFLGERKPVIISGITDSSFTYLVMPMNR